MSDSPPDFTIIMPTRNHARWIEQAVCSVLDQEGAGQIEFLVFDALSDDATPGILARYGNRLTWRCEPDSGQVDAINRGLQLARGEIVAWLNSDDLYLPGALGHVLAAFRAVPDLDFVYGDVLEIDQAGRIVTPNPFTEECRAERYLYSHNFMCQPTVFVRRSVIAEIGLLRRDLHWFMDYEWFARLHKAGRRGTRLKHFLAANRDHPATKTNSGGIARWREAMRVFSANPGPFVLGRRSTWIYSLEYVIKSLNAAGWSAAAELPPDQRTPRQKTVDLLNVWLLRLVQPRSSDDIIRRYSSEIAPCGPNIADVWQHATKLRSTPASPNLSSMPTLVPLAPELSQAYPNLVGQMHDAVRQFLFPQLPLVAGRVELMAKLLGTGIPEAMYLLAELHGALADAGDVCEFGVAQGATSALLANEIRTTTKKLWLYDSFAGLPKPSAEDQLKDDIFRLGSIARYEGEMRCDPAEVRFRLDQVSFPVDRYEVRPGWVQDSLRDENGPASVCFAYVDFDFYAPIAYTLDYLDRHLTPNGRVVVDDYDFFSTGAKTAVDEFVAKHSNYEFVQPAAWAGAFCILRRR